MKLIAIYKCFCDETRLRILNLLSESPLCVCHFQQILDRPQVIISQHLAYLRTHGMVASQRYRQWMIYSLPSSPQAELEANLKCLQDCAEAEPIFKQDRARLRKVLGNKGVQALLDEGCCSSSDNATANRRTRSATP